MTDGAASRTCPACGRPLTLIWVHGHGQCAACGTAVEPCCTGAGDEADDLEPGIDRPSVRTLVAILRDHGPLREEDLLNEFAHHTGEGLELGRALLREAIRLGEIARGTPGVVHVEHH